MIKILGVLVVFFVLLTACGSGGPEPVLEKDQHAPAWYVQQDLAASGYWVGFGDAASLQQAKTFARADLAASLKSQISSSLQISQQLSGDTVTKQVESSVEQVSQVSLEDLTVLKSEQSKGRYFIALGFDYRPLSQRLIDRFSDMGISDQGLQQLSASSLLYQQLIQQLGQVPVLRLYYQGGRYLLVNGDIAEPVREGEIDLLVPRLASSYLSVTFSPSQLVYPPETLFTVKVATRKAGYLSYLQVFSTGETVLMLGNQSVSAVQSLAYPDPQLYDGLVTELPAGKTSTQVHHLIMLCPDKRELSRFEPLSSRAAEKYQSYWLGEWQSVFADCTGVSKQQRIRR